MVSGMTPFFDAFEEYANANIILTAVTAPPALVFGAGVNVIISVNEPAAVCGVKQITSAIYAYFDPASEGMAKAFIEWLPGYVPGIYVTVPSGFETYAGTILSEFGSDTGVTVQLSVQTVLSFGGSVNVIMTPDKISAASLAGGGVTPGDIEERAYMAPDGTIVYIFLRMDAEDATDPLMDWIMNEKLDIRINISSSRLVEMTKFFEAFARYTNVNFILNTYDSGHPPLILDDTVDMVIKNNDTSLIYGCIVIENAAYVFYKLDADGMVKFFIDWLWEQVS
jgi:hypothetical protein